MRVTAVYSCQGREKYFYAMFCRFFSAFELIQGRLFLTEALKKSTGIVR